MNNVTNKINKKGEPSLTLFVDPMVDPEGSLKH